MHRPLLNFIRIEWGGVFLRNSFSAGKFFPANFSPPEQTACSLKIRIYSNRKSPARPSDLPGCLLAGQQEDWILRRRLAVGWGDSSSERSRQICNQRIGNITSEGNRIRGGVDNSDRSCVTDPYVDPAAICVAPRSNPEPC